jgi:hypothetical protein
MQHDGQSPAVEDLPVPLLSLEKHTMTTVIVTLRNFAAAAIALADAWEEEAGSLGHRDVKPTKTAKPRPEAPKLDLAAAKALDAVADREGLTKTETKILTALAQAGRPLSLSQIGTRCGLSSGAGSFAQAVAALRADGYAEGPGAALAITDDGPEALGPFARLPEGSQLFDYWCAKVGSTGGKILVALRQRHREQQGPATLAQLGEATGLSHGAGSFAQALAKLRRLELVEGSGSANVLSPEMRRAVEVTIGVFDRQTGKQIKVDRNGKAVAK